MKAGVIGFPISHSKSPLIHGYWLRRYTITGTYEPIEIHPDAFEQGVEDLIERGLDGFNVTIPHKENIIGLCHQIDDTARILGAVNTVVIKDKKLYGQNTDGFGFIENIKSAQPKFDFTHKNAVVLGAGGAARAIIHALDKAGVHKIILTNRTQTRAENLKELSDKIEICAWENRMEALAGCDLLVNTTSLGMTGKPGLELDLGALPASALVNDIVYAPLMTPLLSAAQAQGNNIVTGIGMLLHQARPAFAAWTGVMPEVDDKIMAEVLA